MGFSPSTKHYTTSSIFSSIVDVASGSFTESLTVSGVPVNLEGFSGYTDSEAIAALEPTTSALAASGVATDTQVTANRTEFVNASGSLQTQIDAVEGSDVDSVNVVTGAVLVTGTQNVTTQTAGQTITITGPDLSSYATSAEVDSDVAAVSGTLSAEIDSDISTHADDYNAHLSKYTIFPFGDSVNSAANRYLKTINGVLCSGTIGYRMSRAGSMVGLGYQCNINGYSSGGTLQIFAFINGGLVFATNPLSITGNGDTGDTRTISRDTVPFVANDILILSVIHTGTYNIDEICAYMSVYLDT